MSQYLKPNLALVPSTTFANERKCSSHYFPQTLFSCFSKPFRLDVDGANGADQFRKKFIGANPLSRLGIYRRFRSEEDLVLLVVKHGGYSCKDAETFIEKVLNREIRYAETKNKTKYFILRKNRAEGYYLMLYERDAYFG